MANKNTPFHPIIYVRGYAMTPGEIDETTADPFCGFNLGSTVYRAVPEKERQPRKFIFESPVIRLASDFGYQDVYEEGYDILDPEWEADPDNKVPSRAIIIFRYYDEASRLLGIGQTPNISQFADKLRLLILRVRELVCKNPANGIGEDDFRCHLVAHSMGGLVCRALLQNPAAEFRAAVKHVDKLFTYATPHNGIEMVGVNIPKWLDMNDMKNFNRDYMAEYLNIKDAFKATGRVDWLPEDSFPSERVFCMVGSNRMDYEAALGMSRTFAGHGSDGLVRIENAALHGWRRSGKNKGSAGDSCAKAFAYRAHSGFFGIVNSEEAFQNLTRFLFGDIRVDLWVDVEQIRLPKPVQDEAQAGRKVSALYQFEILASPRGKLWYLTRRTAEEDSVACLSHEEWMQAPAQRQALYLSSVFLANRARVNPRRRSLAYSMTLGVRVPDYEVDRRLWVNEHYEGGYLFRDSIILEMVPPKADGDAWQVKYAWQGSGVSKADTAIDAKLLGDSRMEVCVPFGSSGSPGMQGQLRFIVSLWNKEAAGN